MVQIDVIMPAYNVARTIGDALGSLQRQTHTDLRVLVVDDGSTDGTADLLAAIARKDPRIVVLRQQNRGTAAARNAALAAASSTYVTQLDADDLSEPDRVARLAAYLDVHPGCVAVSGVARHIDAEGRPIRTVSRFPPPELADPHWVPSREPLCSPFSMWRRSALERVGGYREVGTGQDTDLTWRLLELGDVVNLDAIVGSYRLHDSTTGTSLINGRALATCTQKIAISAQRRKAGRADLAFEYNRMGEFRSASSLAKMVALASTDLSDDECLFFEAAVAAKMLQWIEFRHYLPDEQDVAYIRRAFALTHWLTPSNRQELKRLYSVVAARLARANRWRDAAKLIPPRFTGITFARTVLGR